MSGIEEKIIMEAVKPASGFINALLAPKIEKVKSWAQEKELEGRLDEEKLATTLEQYLLKLSNRVSEITSLSFPLKKLNIFEAYEPLILSKADSSNFGSHKETPLETILNAYRHSFFIVDGAGMGKSTFSKYVVTQLLYKSDRIPILFELRKAKKELDLIDNLARELDFPGKIFERELFYKLLEVGKFYVIIDGFDEVDLDRQEALANEIHELSIKGGENVLLLTSRKQENLPDLVHGTALKFVGFNKTQAKSLLGRYDRVSGLDIGARLIKEIDRVPDRFLESPLLVSLLYRTFGINKSIAERITTFYDEIYDALYKGHDLVNKNGYGREKKSNLDFEDFRKLLRSLCHYMMISRRYSFHSWSEAIEFIEKSSLISNITPSSSSNFLNDLLVAVPLMQKDGSEYKFLHKTLMEYFAAEYLVFDKDSVGLVSKIFNGKLAESYKKTFEFLYDLNSSLFDTVVTHHFSILASDLDLTSDEGYCVFRTSLFVRDYKIGLWSVDEHSVDRANGDDKKSFDFPVVGKGASRATWTKVFIEGKEYYFVVASTEKHRNLHAHAWDSMTKSVNADRRSRSNPSDCAERYFRISGVNSWRPVQEIDFPMYEKIPYVLDIILESSSLEGNKGCRCFCNEKITTVLNRVNSEKEFVKEMELFF